MNSTVYNSLDSILRNQIASGRYFFRANATSTWYYQYNAANTYNYERNGSSYWSNGYVDCNVALLSISDYKYATLSSACSRSDSSNYNSGCSQNNWIGKMMYNSISTNSSWIINPPGYYHNSYGFYAGANYIYGTSSYSSMILTSWTSMNSMYYVFPVFYLKNQGYASKGTGTSNNPYYFSL